MKALVLAGGLGSRLRPLSHSIPKQLIPLANEPVLVHVLRDVRDLGVTQIGLVVGDRGSEITQALNDHAVPGVEITYIHQDEPLGLAHCIAISQDFLGDDDFVMYLGDNMLIDGVREIAADFQEKRPHAQIIVHKVADPRAFGVAEVDEQSRVVRLVEKPTHPLSDLAVIGVYFFTSAVHAAVAAITPSERGELEITDALQWMVDQGAEVVARTYEGYWRDTGKVEDMLDCNRELLDRVRHRVRGEVDEESELFGPVVIEEGARVIRSRVVGPVIIGAGSVVEESFVGPHTSVSGDCLLHAAGLQNSIVLAGATVRRVGGLHASVIGRDATVASAVIAECGRLVVGDHSVVEVTTKDPVTIPRGEAHSCDTSVSDH
ncbi:glucose-1-phosphate thymidylyltransferase [Streptomyces sp. cmx-18-6]|uniref:glucose-1-phosphate thymidylyltransferase n=1 Tax=Streptomyces sp. cmx-18-6 TaxID=2790930 RepID=UPI00397F42C7